VSKTTGRVAAVCFGLFAFGVLVSPVLFAQSAPPPGSYAKTCINAKMVDDRLTADCPDGGGKMQPAVLSDAWTCVNDIANSNGQLKCQGNFGRYENTCTGIRRITFANGEPVLGASCQNFYGQAQESYLDAPDSCGDSKIGSLTGVGPSARILNINGFLRCVTWYRLDASGQGNQDIVSKTVWTGKTLKHTFWVIDQPLITQPQSSYPDVTYQAGDTLVLNAGGCAQSGGHGDTWYNYVSPQANAGEYYGMVDLPRIGVGSGSSSDAPAWSKIQDIAGRDYPVLTGSLDKNLFLSLGYWDDGWPNSQSGYSDNGYYAPDGGEDGQCPKTTGFGPAWVYFEVEHPLDPSTAPAPYSPGTKPFDLIYDRIDGNGLPWNPEWYSQKHSADIPNFRDTCSTAFSTPSFSGWRDVGFFLSFGTEDLNRYTQMDSSVLQKVCTTQDVGIDQFDAYSSPGSLTLALGNICPAQPIRGHLNWWPVTYTGELHFSDWSGVWPQDYDVNMSLVPGTSEDDGTKLSDDGGLSSGLAAGNSEQKTSNGSELAPYGGLLLEFDSQETVQPYFAQRPGGTFWHAFATGALAAGPSGFISAASSPSPDPQATSVVNQFLWHSQPGATFSSTSTYTANAVVTGLMGVDGAHDPGISELHPVLSMAVHVMPDDDVDPQHKSEHWAFFIRNQGDEGNCSNGPHTLEPEEGTQDYYITLPWPKDATALKSATYSGSTTPWVSGVTISKTQSEPGVGSYLHFQSPPSSNPDQAQFFGVDGEVTLEYEYPANRAPKKAQHDDSSGAADHTAKKDDAKAVETGDAEEFPAHKLIDSATDPAVKAHMQRFFEQKPAAQAIPPALPALHGVPDVETVKSKPLPDAKKLARRSRSFLDVSKMRRNDDLAFAAGSRRRTFQATDANHVFVLGTDRVLRLYQMPSPAIVIDREVTDFDAASQGQLLVLRKSGTLLLERAPFGGAEGACIEGFVWRQVNPDDHVCVLPAQHAQAAADTAASRSHLAPPLLWRQPDVCDKGFVWRQAYQDDHACVSSETRKQTAADNAAGPYRVAGTGGTALVGLGISKFSAAANGGALLLDTNGSLWWAAKLARGAAKPVKVADQVRAFQNLDADHALVLTTDDHLRSISVTTGNASPTVIDNAWDFHSAADGSLFVIDADDNLWQETPHQQVDTAVKSVQALNASTLFVLKLDGTLSMRTTANTSGASSRPVASGVRAFQAVDAQALFTEGSDGKLWFIHGALGSQNVPKSVIATDIR
jgi:hypothetical protein